MNLEGDFLGQSNALIATYALRHICHKIAFELFDIFTDRWKQIQVYRLKVHRALYFALSYDLNSFLMKFYPILTYKTLF